MKTKTDAWLLEYLTNRAKKLSKKEKRGVTITEVAFQCLGKTPKKVRK